MTATHALFPGTFDPFTLGHLDVLQRAARIFDRVTVGVAAHHAKDHLLGLEERIALIEASLGGMSNVQAKPIQGLLVDGARELGAHTILRGVRTAADLEYERQMSQTNRALWSNVDTVFLLPSPTVAHISSTLVRQIARMDGDITPFVAEAALPLIASAVQREGEGQTS
jgi:pantetheine-phosphate adenylyltransferase